MPSKKRKRKPGNLFLKALTVTALLLCAFFLTRQFLAAAISDVQFLTSQEVGQTTPFDGILIKDEKVVRSPANGRLHFTEPDGRRLEVGAKAAEIEISAEQGAGGSTVDVNTDSAGILCTHLDGLENILSPENIGVLDLPSLEKIGGKPAPEGTRAEKGQPIFKIIDNLSPVSIYGAIPKPALPDGYMDKPGWIQATWDNYNFKIKPANISDKGDRWEGFFLMSGYPEQIVHYRKVRLIVTTRQLKGLLVPHKAIVYRDGKPGVYLAVKKKAQWAPVKIEGELAGRVAVSGEGFIEGTRYVSNPVLSREGWLVE